MKLLKKAQILGVTLALTFMLNASAAFAGTVTWTDWNHGVSGIDGTATGTMKFGDEIVDVTLSGVIMDIFKGDAYYNNASTGYTSPEGTYSGLEPFDVIRESQTGHVEITFSKPVEDIHIALMSVGGYSSVDYAFESPFEVVSVGPNVWGYGSYSVDGNTFTGQEANGILEFEGTYSTFAFDINNAENWHGFNIGATPAPEPSTMLLGLMGLGSAALRRRKRKA